MNIYTIYCLIILRFNILTLIIVSACSCLPTQPVPFIHHMGSLHPNKMIFISGIPNPNPTRLVTFYTLISFMIKHIKQIINAMRHYYKHVFLDDVKYKMPIEISHTCSIYLTIHFSINVPGRFLYTKFVLQ